MTDVCGGSKIMRSGLARKIQSVWKSDRGWTLIELIVVLVVTGVITVSVFPLFKTNVQSYMTVRSGKDLMQSSRIGFMRMMNELQRLTASVDISYGTTNRIDFDIPDDGLGSITYKLSSGTLLRENVLLLENVKSFTISYFTEDGTQKSTPFFWDSDVWRIRITLVVGNDTTEMTLSGQVSPRNIYY